MDITEIFASLFAVGVIALIAVKWQTIMLESESSFIDEIDQRDAELRGNDDTTVRNRKL